MMLLWTSLYNVNTLSLRFFNIYGPGQAEACPYAFVIAKFLKQRRECKPLTIVGTGDQTRDFVHVSDVVNACIQSLTADTTPGDVINIGYGKGVSINTIAKLIGGEKQYVDTRIEPKDAQAHIKKANQILNWKPTISVKQGISQLLVLEDNLYKILC